MLTFDSCHEYYLGNDPSIYYCDDHEALILTQDHSDRILVNGLSNETMLKFARKLVQEDLDKCLAKYQDKDAVAPLDPEDPNPTLFAKEPADVES